MLKIKKYHLILIAIIIIGGALRFYNLDWGQGNFFHPDEGNIGSAVVQLDVLNGDYNPNFFAYGTLPIYLVHFFAKQDYSNAMLYGRLLSALISTLTIPLVFAITQALGISLLAKNSPQAVSHKLINRYALAAAALVGFAPGLIQFAHFGTFESYLGFEHLLTVYIAIRLMHNPSWKNYIFLGLILGISIATKIPSIAFFPIIFMAHGYVILKRRHEETNRLKFITSFIGNFLFSAKASLAMVVMIAFAVLNTLYFFTDPQTLQDYRGSLSYEGPVATGKLAVFYTQQYIETTPVVYQFTKVFPVIMGWPLTVLSVVAVVYVIFYSIKFALIFVFKNKYSHKTDLSIFTAIMLVYAAFNFYLYVKWTRYMIPLLPFLVIACVLFLLKFHSLTKKTSAYLASSIIICLVAYQVIIGIDFFTIYLKPDPRVEAGKWVNENVALNSFVLTETADRGVPAIRGDIISSNVKEYEFYNLDDGFNTEDEIEELVSEIEKADYIFVPSKRIFPTRSRLKDKFPLGYNYYNALFSGELGFELVADFDRTPKLTEWWSKNIADNQTTTLDEFKELNYDETFRVFDQPTVYIFKKANPDVDYNSIFALPEDEQAT